MKPSDRPVCDKCNHQDGFSGVPPSVSCRSRSKKPARAGHVESLRRSQSGGLSGDMPASCEELMLLLLHEDSRTSENDDFNAAVALLRKGNFDELFQFPWFEAFKLTPPETLQSKLRSLTDGEPDMSEERSLKLLFAGVAFLYFFFRRNFMGPSNEESAFFKGFESARRGSTILNLDGEQAYHLVRDPAALYLSKEIFIGMADELKSFQTLSVWQNRYAMTHQQLISERVQTLQEIVETSTRDPEDDLFVDHLELWSQRHLETALANLEFFNEAQAGRLLKEVSERLGFDVKLDGALGTRTRFQQKSVAQLTLTVERSKPACTLVPSPDHEDSLPKDVALNDETVLPNIKFDQEQENSRLNFVEQTIVLGVSLLRKCLNGVTELLEEEVIAHYARLVTDPQLWGVQFSALYQRSRIEIQKSRKVERALSQFQHLLDCVNARDKIQFSERCRMVFACRIPPIWKLERDVAYGFVSLGLTKSALDIFLRLEMWEEVVNCYAATMRNDRAEVLLNELLKTEETPLLRCLLGEITGDTSQLDRAWSLSGESFARAKRSLGGYHYGRKEYEAAIPHFEQALALNRLQCTTWHKVAFCYMQSKRYVECVSAYKETVNLNPDNFEAWNNMAKAYISLDDRDKAWRVLQEALKCNYDDWRIWENYVLVSMDVRAFNEVIKGWHRLLDLKRKFADGKLAHLLVKVVAENVKDIDGNPPASYLRKKLFELFARITGTITANDEIWSAYGDLYFHTDPADGSSWAERTQKIVQCYQKALRFTMQTKAWEKNSESASNVLVLLERIWTVLDHMSEKLSPEEKERIRASVQMTSRNATSPVSRCLEYFDEATRGKFEKSIERIEAHH